MVIMSNTINYTDKYDIFISYRRDGGEAMAILLRDRLTAKGYNVFLDIENLNSGSFNTKLFDVMDGCKDVIVVCSIGSLDRCVNDGDWVRLEIARAIEKGKNIVPIMLRGFAFPENLPADIANISMQNGVSANSHEYFDAAIERLQDKFLQSTPRPSELQMSERLQGLISHDVAALPKKRSVKPFAAIIAILLVAVIYFAVNTFGEGGTGGAGDIGGKKRVEITVYNNTPDTVNSVCFKRSTAEQWGENLVKDNPLESGETLTVKFPEQDVDFSVTYDMRNIFYFEGDTAITFTMSGFTLYEISEIVLYVDDNGEYAREFIREGG